MTSPPSPFPTIDISPFLSPHPNPKTLTTTAAALSAACAHPGFFYLKNHNLPPTLTTNVLTHAREFFLTTPPTEKARLARKEVGLDNGDGARGYQTIGDNVTEGKRDWHEAIDWYRPVRVGEPYTASHGDMDGAGIADRQGPYKLLQGLNAWPASPPSFRPVYEEYIRCMLKLGTAVVRALGMALGGGMDDVFVRNTRESWWVMRAIGYPPLPSSETVAARAEEEEEEGEGGVSCGAHSDYGCVTLLLADETKGALQAWVGDEGEEGGRWVDADPVPGALVVNIGDMMSRWSGGKWKATRHRVVHTGAGFRVSVPFFFEPDWDARVPGGEGEGDVVYGEYLEGKVKGNF